MAKVKNLQEFIARRDEEDLRSILKLAYGKRFISRLLISCGVHRTGVNFDSVNATYFNAGMRSIGNALLEEVMRINPEAYQDMKRMDKEDEDARTADRQHRSESE